MHKKLPGQKGKTIWLFGLSGAGKSTIASLLEEMFHQNNLFCIRLDGDQLRDGINAGLGFTDEGRAENIRRTSEIAKILCGNNVITICSLITPLNSHRDIARDILGDKLLEVFVDCPIAICEQRDVKGLYKKARQHKIRSFTGYDSVFERPEPGVMTLETHTIPAIECARMVFEKAIGDVKLI